VSAKRGKRFAGEFKLKKGLQKNLGKNLKFAKKIG
jgi:hypothetical protein